MKDGLFRKAALDRLSSPDELDSLLQVTSPKAWIVLLAVGLVTVAVLLWSVFGRLPSKVNAQQCILVKSGGITLTTASSSGRLTDLSVERGDRVVRGQIIGRIDQYDTLQKIKVTEARLIEAQLQLQQTRQAGQELGRLRALSYQQQREASLAQITAAERQIGLLKERIRSQQALLEQGLLTRQTLISTQLELSAAQLQVEASKSQIKQAEVSREDANTRSSNEIAQAARQVEEIKALLDSLGREAKTAGLVVSPAAGRVLEVTVSDGQFVDRGMPMVSIESSGNDRNEVEAFIYLPAAEGKRMRIGMSAEISPSTARREEYGFLSGSIASVAEYPSSDKGLMQVFGNEKLVQQLVGSTPPIQLVATLNPAPETPSGYAWSTRQGPPFTIQNGTLCQASITLSVRRPITLVIPALKRFLGLE
ncbi:NHLP bacteriocin system secretion protein [Roseateles sp. DB2]|uniref:NHLP bacteriocin system secretion protein n=1 Tax=Roseateles sp. DB2 TaxID=3453717 RepID=UPI003EED1B15